MFGVHADTGVAHLEAQFQPAQLALAAAHCDADLALAGELDGIADQVGDHLAQAQRVADQLSRHLGRDLEQEFESLLLGPLPDEGDHRLEHFVEFEGVVLEHQLAGLDAGKVQDVVDQREQAATGGVDLAHVVALLGVEVAGQRQSRQADDRIHRRADLVAHVGEEARLGLGGFLGQSLGFRQGPGRLAAGVDVLEHPDALTEAGARRDQATDRHHHPR